MLFDSKDFLFVFLPLVLAVFFTLTRFRCYQAAKIWLLLASFFAYFCWDPVSWPLTLVSVLVNYRLAKSMARREGESRRKRLWLAILFNVLLLGFFKYTDFIFGTFAGLFNFAWIPLNLVLPLGISFYTFVQIAYQVDIYEQMTAVESFLDYALFILFFPKLASGPITHQEEVVPQWKEPRNLHFNFDNFSAGLLLILIGLAKKVVLADNLSAWADVGFSSLQPLNFLQAWVTSLSYTMTIYFDFSGYTDMALGVAMLFNIALPNNFNSPFQARSVIEFWQRWHITLTRFLTTYIFSAILRYFEQITFTRFLIATLVTMFISGLWHGAAWVYAAFGLFHGLALVVNHIWRRNKLKMPSWLAWVLTFNFINVSYVFFRSPSLTEAWKVVRGMFGFSGFAMPPELHPLFGKHALLQYAAILPSAGNSLSVLLILAVLVVICLCARNSVQLVSSLKQKPILVGALFMLIVFYSIILFGKLDNTVYVYFQF